MLLPSVQDGMAGRLQSMGCPYGTTVPAVLVIPIGNLSLWRFDAWAEGDGCFCLDALGHHGEIHFRPAPQALSGASQPPRSENGETRHIRTEIDHAVSARETGRNA